MAIQIMPLDGNNLLAGLDDEFRLLFKSVELEANVPPPQSPPQSSALPPPILPPPTVQFSAEDLAAQLSAMQTKTREAQLRTAAETLKTVADRTAKANEEAVQKILDALDLAKSAAAKEKVSNILKIVGSAIGLAIAVVGLVLAVAATISSGGIAVPLAVIAVAGVIGAGFALADSISHECDGPSLALSTLSTKLCKLTFTPLLGSLGVSDDKIENISKIIVGASAILTIGMAMADPSTVGNMVGAIAELSGGDEEAVMWATMVGSVATGVIAALIAIGVSIAVAVAIAACTSGAGIPVSAFVIAAGIGVALASLAQAGVTVTAGGFNIAKAVDERKIGDLQHDNKIIDALLIALQQQTEEQQEQIRKITEELMDGYKIVMQMFSTAADSRHQLATNLGTRIGGI